MFMMPRSPVASSPMIDSDTRIRFEEIAVGDAPTRAVFAFHGYGANAKNLLLLVNHMLHDDVVYIVPDGIAPCEGNEFVGPGEEGGRQWFSIENLAPNVLAPTVSAVSKTLMHFINNQLQRLGIKHADAVLFGFSQGAILASSIGTKMLPALGGVIACSGCVLPITDEQIISKTTPYALIHGKDDSVLGVDMSRAGLDELLQAGVPAEGYFLDDVGHLIDDRGLEIINRKLLEYLDL